eukprot:TRINITY_DN1463_c0_g4_i1.p1 TRINITY_DN1463_c0_g4~~TRINITY_DN1463_c0_g4_i1.p1  ORF type:complete len:1658 (-),score=452.80 TRINITY_DN1463_c0_g4_i1:8-4981(-)
MSSMEEDKDTKNIPVFNLFDAAGGDDSSTDFFGSLIKSNTEPKGNTPVQNNNVDSLFGGSNSGGSFFDSLGQTNGQSGSTTAPRPFENSPAPKPAVGTTPPTSGFVSTPTHAGQPKFTPASTPKTPLNVFTPTAPTTFTPTPGPNITTSYGTPTSNPTTLYNTAPPAFRPIPPPSVPGVQVFSPQLPTMPTVPAVKYTQPVSLPFTPPKPLDLLATAAPKQPVTPVNTMLAGPPPVSPYQPVKPVSLLPGTPPTTGPHQPVQGKPFTPVAPVLKPITSEPPRVFDPSAAIPKMPLTGGIVPPPPVALPKVITAPPPPISHVTPTMVAPPPMPKAVNVFTPTPTVSHPPPPMVGAGTGANTAAPLPPPPMGSSAPVSRRKKSQEVPPKTSFTPPGTHVSPVSSNTGSVRNSGEFMQSMFASGEFSANTSEKDSAEELPAIREEPAHENNEDQSNSFDELTSSGGLRQREDYVSQSFDELADSGGIRQREDYVSKSFDEINLDESNNTSFVDLNESQPDQSYDQTGNEEETTEGDGLNESGFFDEIDLNAIPDLTDTSNTVPKQPTTPAVPSMMTVTKSTFTPVPAPPALKTAFVPIPPPSLPKVSSMPVPLPVPINIPGMPSGNMNQNPSGISTFTPVAPIPSVTVSHPIPIPTQKTSFVPNVFNSSVTGTSSSNLPSIGTGALRKPHPLVSFGFGGKVVVMFPTIKFKINVVMPGQFQPENEEPEKAPGHIQIHSMQRLLASTNVVAEINNFPGPLNHKVKSSIVSKFIADRVNEVMRSREFDIHSEGVKMLWEFLKILVNNNGVLSSPQGDSTQAEKDIHSLLMTEQDATWVTKIQSSNFLLPTSTKTDLEIRQALSEMQDLLIRGKKEEALRLALDAQLWPHAMLISRTMSPEAFAQTVSQFACSSLPEGSPLRTLYLLLVGRTDDLLNQTTQNPATPFFPLNTQFGAPTVTNVLTPTSSQTTKWSDRWRENVAIILGNRFSQNSSLSASGAVPQPTLSSSAPGAQVPTPQQQQQMFRLQNLANSQAALIKFGDLLWTRQHAPEAAHFCYLLAEHKFDAYDEANSRLVLVGGDHRKDKKTFINVDTVHSTEIYEYSRRLTNNQFTLPAFQVYKFIHATYLIDLGFVEKAWKYMNSITAMIKDQKGAYKYSPLFANLFREYLSRLEVILNKSAQAEDSSGSWFGKLGQAVTKGINTIMGGDEPTTPQHNPAAGHHQPHMHPGHGMPSHSPYQNSPYTGPSMPMPIPGQQHFGSGQFYPTGGQQPYYGSPMGVPTPVRGPGAPMPISTPPQVNFMPKPYNTGGSAPTTPLQFQMSGEFTNVPLNAEPPKRQQQKVETYARDEDSSDSEEERRQQEKARKQKEEKKRQKEQEEKKKKEADKKKANQEGGDANSGITSKVKNLLGSGFGIFKKGKKEVKLGDDNKFYFNKDLKMWVERGKEDEALKKAAPPPPPPTMSSMMPPSPMPAAQTPFSPPPLSQSTPLRDSTASTSEGAESLTSSVTDGQTLAPLTPSTPGLPGAGGMPKSGNRFSKGAKGRRYLGTNNEIVETHSPSTPGGLPPMGGQSNTPFKPVGLVMPPPFLPTPPGLGAGPGAISTLNVFTPPPPPEPEPVPEEEKPQSEPEPQPYQPPAPVEDTSEETVNEEVPSFSNDWGSNDPFA